MFGAQVMIGGDVGPLHGQEKNIAKNNNYDRYLQTFHGHSQVRKVMSVKGVKQLNYSRCEVESRRLKFAQHTVMLIKALIDHFHFYDLWSQKGRQQI
jgi:hypothetical protein